MMPTQPQTLLGGRFQIGSELGRGGMATVFQATDITNGRKCAVKVIHPELATNTHHRTRFICEARTLEKLSHPNIVRLACWGSEGNALYMVLDLLEGGDLESRIRVHGPLPALQAAQVMSGVLDAVVASHAAGIVHRDIKPTNILLSRDGVPSLTDFGISRDIDPDDQPMGPRRIQGTMGYMAPEQRSGCSPSRPSADIYGTGATLFALLTGRSPISLGDSEVRESALEDLEPALRAIVRRATEADPTMRFGSADDMHRAIQGALPALPPLSDDVAPLATQPLHQEHVADSATELEIMEIPLPGRPQGPCLEQEPARPWKPLIDPHTLRLQRSDPQRRSRVGRIVGLALAALVLLGVGFVSGAWILPQGAPPEVAVASAIDVGMHLEGPVVESPIHEVVSKSVIPGIQGKASLLGPRGRLAVDSLQVASLLVVDGRGAPVVSCTLTPCTVDLPPEEYSLILEAARGRRFVVPVNLRADQPTRLCVDVASGRGCPSDVVERLGLAV